LTRELGLADEPPGPKQVNGLPLHPTLAAHSSFPTTCVRQTNHCCPCCMRIYHHPLPHPDQINSNGQPGASAHARHHTRRTAAHPPLARPPIPPPSHGAKTPATDSQKPRGVQNPSASRASIGASECRTNPPHPTPSSHLRHPRHPPPTAPRPALPLRPLPRLKTLPHLLPPNILRQHPTSTLKTHPAGPGHPNSHLPPRPVLPLAANVPQTVREQPPHLAAPPRGQEAHTHTYQPRAAGTGVHSLHAPRHPQPSGAVHLQPAVGAVPQSRGRVRAVRSVKSVRILLAAKSAGDAAGGGVQGVCVGAVRPVAATGAARGRRDPRGADRAQGFLPVPVVLACHPCCLRAAEGFPRVPTGCGDAEVCVLCAGARDWEVVGGEFGWGWESAGVCFSVRRMCGSCCWGWVGESIWGWSGRGSFLWIGG
jgi:hypothetical protein